MSRFSIALCTYNGSQYLSEQLASYTAQSRRPDELIVCDDGSCDDTITIIEEFAARAPFPVELHRNETNLGVVKNFEKAIGLCRGDFIVLSDQDDVWHPQKLSALEKAFLENPHAGLVFSDSEMVDDQLRPLGHSLWQTPFFAGNKPKLQQGHAFDLLLAHDVVTGAATAFRSSYKSLVLPIPDDIPALHDSWSATLIAAVADIIFIDEPLIQYRQHSSQQTRHLYRSNAVRVRVGDAEVARWWQNHYAAHVRQFQALEQRLAAQGAAHATPQHQQELTSRLRAIQAKRRHIQNRTQLPTPRILRLPQVMRELVTGRYHAYSNGFYSAAKDLLS